MQQQPARKKRDQMLLTFLSHHRFGDKSKEKKREIDKGSLALSSAIRSSKVRSSFKFFKVQEGTLLVQGAKLFAVKMPFEALNT